MVTLSACTATTAPVLSPWWDAVNSLPTPAGGRECGDNVAFLRSDGWIRSGLEAAQAVASVCVVGRVHEVDVVVVAVPDVGEGGVGALPGHAGRRLAAPQQVDFF